MDNLEVSPWFRTKKALKKYTSLLYTGHNITDGIIYEGQGMTIYFDEWRKLVQFLDAE